MLVCENNFKIYMNNKCKNLKQKFDRTFFCKKKNKLIKINECTNCESKQFKTTIYNNERKIKNRSSKQNKKERNRYSIIYKNLTSCAICSSKIGIEKNEVFEGAKRGASMKYGFIIPLCSTCHKRFHSDRQFALSIKRQFQKEFEKIHSREEFLDIIHRNYLD
ncbi:MAG TPA: hypothetical protein DCE23_04475 [Firmicutes bacterium]|nr:hypothetical protein [Bacillota bacterium]